MSPQKFILDFEARENDLYAHLSGKDSFAASLDYWNQIVDQVQKLNVTKVLVHENLTGEVSEGELFDVIMDILPSSSGIQVAFYDENDADRSINEFGRLVSNNRGADIQIFQSLETAEKWIQEA